MRQPVPIIIDRFHVDPRELGANDHFVDPDGRLVCVIPVEREEDYAHPNYIGRADRAMGRLREHYWRPFAEDDAEALKVPPRPYSRPGLRHGRGFAATDQQRRKMKTAVCVNCRRPGVDPAHLVPKSLAAQRCHDALCVIPLCRLCHDAYDDGGLDILASLERWWRPELGHAVAHIGLLPTLRQVTGTRWIPENPKVGHEGAAA